MVRRGQLRSRLRGGRGWYASWRHLIRTHTNKDNFARGEGDDTMIYNIGTKAWRKAGIPIHRSLTLTQSDSKSIQLTTSTPTALTA